MQHSPPGGEHPGTHPGSPRNASPTGGTTVQATPRKGSQASPDSPPPWGPSGGLSGGLSRGAPWMDPPPHRLSAGHDHHRGVRGFPRLRVDTRGGNRDGGGDRRAGGQNPTRGSHEATASLGEAATHTTSWSVMLDMCAARVLRRHRKRVGEERVNTRHVPTHA